MKTYKSKENKYGWYWVIHQNKNGDIKIFRKCVSKERRNYENEIYLDLECVKLLKEILKLNKDKDVK